MVMMMCFCIIEMFIMDCELNKYKIKFRFDIRVLSLVICCWCRLSDLNCCIEIISIKKINLKKWIIFG